MESVRSVLDPDNPNVWSYCVAGGAILVTSIVAYRCLRGRSKDATATGPRDTVVLHQFDRALCVPSLSPFVLKLETYLRMANVPYECKLNSRFSKKHKLPWMTYNGVEVPDSQFCMQYLNGKRSVDLNRHLKPEEKAVAKSFQVMVDEHAYWSMVYYRWCRDKGLKMMKENISRSSPTMWLIQWNIKRQLWGQGMGRHSPEEIKQFLMSDVAALANFLGRKSFLMGETPCQEDCAVFGLLAQFTFNDTDEELGHFIPENFPNLEQYCIRMKKKFWPDWDDCLLKKK